MRMLMNIKILTGHSMKPSETGLRRRRSAAFWKT